MDPLPRSVRLAEELLTRVADLDIENPSQTRTPERFTSMLMELTTSEDFHFTTFESDHDQMVIVSPIPLYSLCAHHVMPFIGSAHVAYVPQGKIAGLSKIARTVKHHMRGLWEQEHLTEAIANFLEKELEPLGVALVIKAEHLCMTMRGVQSAGTRTTTSAMRGCFLDPKKDARYEFLRLIEGDL